MSNSSDTDTSRHGINLWAALLIITGMALILFSHADQFDVHPTIKHFSESLGHALFIFGLISVFLEFRDFTEYVSCVLQKQLLNRDYIRKMGVTELQGLKRDVDEVLVGTSGLMSHGGFYEFIDQHFDVLIKAPYRTRMIEINDFAYDHTDRSHFWKSSTTTYNFVKGFAGKVPMTIKWTWSTLPLTSGSPRDQIRDLVISYTSKGTKHTFKLFKPTAATDPLTLKADDGQRINLLETQTTLPMKSPSIQLRFEYEIPESHTFPPLEEVVVEMRDEVLIDAVNDNFSSLRLNYPTHGVIVEANFPPDVHAHQCVHGFSLQKVEPMVEHAGKCFTNIAGWCLPGHGVITIWQLPAPAKPVISPGARGSVPPLTTAPDMFNSSTEGQAKTEA